MHVEVEIDCIYHYFKITSHLFYLSKEDDEVVVKAAAVVVICLCIAFSNNVRMILI